MQKPSAHDYKVVRNFLEHDGGRLWDAELAFIYEQDDLITLRPRTETA